MDTTATPRRRMRSFAIFLILSGFLGCIVGLGGFTIIYAKGYSYLTDDPSACANCHVMRDVYTAWSRGSHRSVATCNDCHIPHDNLFTKWGAKALNGFRHSAAFTLGNFPEPIRISDWNRDIARRNCLTCHADLTAMINHAGNPQLVDCLLCHARVGHDE